MREYIIFTMPIYSTYKIWYARACKHSGASVSNIKISIDDKSLVTRARDKSFLWRILSRIYECKNTVVLAELERLHLRDHPAMYVKNEPYFILASFRACHLIASRSESHKSFAIKMERKKRIEGKRGKKRQVS